MLTSLRHAAGTWVAKLLLVLLVLSFAVWGISGQILGGAGGNVVTAGNTGVSVLEYRLAYDRQVSMLSQQFGVRLTREQAVALGIDQQVLSQLVAGAVLDEQAGQMGLGLSRERLALLTAEDPAFRGAGGRFDRNQFDFVLRQVGMRPEDYLRSRQQQAIREQILEAVAQDVRVPDTFLRAMALYSGEDRTVEYVRLPRSLVEPVPAPSDEELAAFFQENRARYAAPEYRTISYVKLEPEDIADPAAVTEEDARAYFEQNAVRFTRAERRRIEQIVFPNEEAAREAADRIRAGTSFEEIVAGQGRAMSDVLLGTYERSGVADPAIAEAAFALDEGEVSDVVRGTFGHLIVRASDIQPEEVRPFEAVSAEIRAEIALDEASRVLYEAHDAYEDARAAGESMSEAAARLNLRVVTIEAVDSAGRAPDGTDLSDEIPEAQDLLSEAFDTEAGMENPPLNIGASGFLFYEVDAIMPARDRDLEEVRERVVADWTARQAADRLAELAADLERQLRDGVPFAEIAEAHGLEVRTRRGLRRESDGQDLGNAGVAAAFGVARGDSGVVPAGGGVQVLFRVTEIFEPLDAAPQSVPQQTRDRLASGLEGDLVDQLVGRLQTQYQVTVNRAAMNQALSF